MSPPITCTCGQCKTCKQREYMRAYYARNPGQTEKQRVRARERWHKVTKHQPRPPVEMVTVPCSFCGKPLERQAKLRAARGYAEAFCDHTCKNKHRHAREAEALRASKPQRICSWCGRELPKSKRADARYCCNQHEQADRNMRRKALRTCSVVERISRWEIIVRDKAICHICGKHVPDDEISLDHVIARSRGGEHTYANVKLSHLACNLRKAVTESR